MMGHKDSAWTFWLVMAIMVITLYAPFAMAIGDDASLGSFSCSGGVASGQLYLNGSCPTTFSFNNVFSFLVCNMQSLATNLLGHMYCGLIAKLAPAIWAAATMAVLFFGISFTMGLTAATGREAIVFLLKIAFVTGFATNADMLIGVAYRTLMSAMTDGVAIVISGMGIPDAINGTEAFGMLDRFLERIFDYAVGGIPSQAGPDKCRGAVFAVIATMAVAFPLVAYMALALIVGLLMSFFRAVFGYIYAIFAITFLMVVSPFFLAFYLFKPTQSYFDKWLGNLASFVIQAVMLFAFLMFILSLPISNVTNKINDIVIYLEDTTETSAIRLPWKYCTLCDFQFVDKTNPTRVLTDKEDDFLTKAELQCKIYPVNMRGPSFDPTKEATDAAGRKALSISFAVAPSDTGAATSSDKINALLKLAGSGILSLIILVVIVQKLLGMIPTIAQRLGNGLGGSYTPALGGETATGIPGFSLPGESMAKSAARGFDAGVRRSMVREGADGQPLVSRDTHYAFGTGGVGADSGQDRLNKSHTDGMREGISSMMTGRGNEAQGLAQRWKDWTAASPSSAQATVPRPDIGAGASMATMMAATSASGSLAVQTSAPADVSDGIRSRGDGMKAVLAQQGTSSGRTESPDASGSRAAEDGRQPVGVGADNVPLYSRAMYRPSAAEPQPARVEPEPTMIKVSDTNALGTIGTIPRDQAPAESPAPLETPAPALPAVDPNEPVQHYAMNVNGKEYKFSSAQMTREEKAAFKEVEARSAEVRTAQGRDKIEAMERLEAAQERQVAMLDGIAARAQAPAAADGLQSRSKGFMNGPAEQPAAAPNTLSAPTPAQANLEADVRPVDAPAPLGPVASINAPALEPAPARTAPTNSAAGFLDEMDAANVQSGQRLDSVTKDGVTTTTKTTYDINTDGSSNLSPSSGGVATQEAPPPPEQKKADPYAPVVISDQLKSMAKQNSQAADMVKQMEEENARRAAMRAERDAQSAKAKPPSDKPTST